MNSYHNTTHLSGPALAEAEGEARTQEDQILEYFRNCYRANEGRKTTSMRSPSQVWKFFGQGWPITSVRRAITNLTTSGKMEQVKGETRSREYGRPEGCWIYRPQPVAGEQGKLF